MLRAQVPQAALGPGAVRLVVVVEGSNGEIDYRRFDAISDMEVVADGNLAVLRYQSAIDFHVAGEEAGPLECWHMDCYRRTPADAPWQVIWSQAKACN